MWSSACPADADRYTTNHSRTGTANPIIWINRFALPLVQLIVLSFTSPVFFVFFTLLTCKYYFLKTNVKSKIVYYFGGKIFKFL